MCHALSTGGVERVAGRGTVVPFLSSTQPSVSWFIALPPPKQRLHSNHESNQEVFSRRQGNNKHLKALSTVLGFYFRASDVLLNLLTDISHPLKRSLLPMFTALSGSFIFQHTCFFLVRQTFPDCNSCP